MKKISFIVRNDPALLNNRIFSGESLYGMKCDNYPFIALKDRFNALGVRFDTYDLLPPNEADIIICLDEVNTFQQFDTVGIPSYLIISEPPVYAADNWLVANHENFDKIFTYDENMLISPKYFHYFFPIEFKRNISNLGISSTEFINRKLCNIIAGAFQITKPKSGSKSLLYERYKSIRWFSKFHSKDFDFYGRNIIQDKFTFFSGAGILKKVNLKRVIGVISSYYSKSVLRVYKGEIPPLKKNEIQGLYNFSICYENTHSIKGLISERIFDCFESRSVPIYWGAPNIDSYIPPNCFIDRRLFATHLDLYKFIKNMTYKEYANYLSSAKNFLLSKEIYKFSVNNYVSIITSNILEEIAIEKGNLNL